MKIARVLIVDDEVDLLDIVGEQLELEGHPVLKAASVDEAIELLNRNADIDIILSDIRLPQRSGLELLQHTSKPIIFMSGFADIGEKTVCEMGAVALICKPFRIEKFLEILGEVVAA